MFRANTHNNLPRIAVVIALVLGAAFFRLVPHPANFAPMTAVALFAGAHLAGFRWAAVVPVLAMFLSDLVLEVVTGQGFHSLMPVIYFAYAAVAFGAVALKQRSVARIAGASVLASTWFFIVTNFGVWATGTMYPMSSAGLVACFTAAVPFFGATFAGDAFFTAVFFGGYALAARWSPALASATHAAA